MVARYRSQINHYPPASITGYTVMPEYNIRQPYWDDWSAAQYSKHICSDQTNPGPPYKTGGPLYIEHYKGPEIWTNGVWGSHNVTGGWCGYEGWHWVSLGIANPGPPSWGPWDNSDLNTLGTTAWHKFKPGKPSADLGVMIAEMRDLPKMWKQAKDGVDFFRRGGNIPSPKNAANGFLSYNFGWAPFVKDLQKLYNTSQTVDSRLNRLRKYNGRWERRGGVVKEDMEQMSYQTTGGMLPAPPLDPIEPVSIVEEVGTRIWFTAKFKYYIQNFDSPFTDARLRMRQFGLTSLPSVLWELMPWSWLIDWASNVGDLVSNLDNIDGLVAADAYVMRTNYATKSASVTQTYTGWGFFPTVTFSASNFVRWETKSRSQASPFGFGMSDCDFSLRQWAILAALGIQRAL